MSEPTAVPAAVTRAAEFGHKAEWDPPANVLTAARRWTCKCGATVIDYQGNIYGSAVERSCSRPSVGDYLQFEVGELMSRFGWNGPWPPPEKLAFVVGESGVAVAEDTPELDTLHDKPGGADLTVYRCVRVSHSSLPPQNADSHVARGALYHQDPEAT